MTLSVRCRPGSRQDCRPVLHRVPSSIPIPRRLDPLQLSLVDFLDDTNDTGHVHHSPVDVLRAIPRPTLQLRRYPYAAGFTSGATRVVGERAFQPLKSSYDA